MRGNGTSEAKANGSKVNEAGSGPDARMLMHEDEQVPATLNALKLYLPEFQKTGLKAVTVPQLLALDPPPLEQVAKGSGGCNSSWRGP